VGSIVHARWSRCCGRPIQGASKSDRSQTSTDLTHLPPGTMWLGSLTLLVVVVTLVSAKTVGPFIRRCCYLTFLFAANRFVADCRSRFCGRAYREYQLPLAAVSLSLNLLILSSAGTIAARFRCVGARLDSANSHSLEPISTAGPHFIFNADARNVILYVHPLRFILMSGILERNAQSIVERARCCLQYCPDRTSESGIVSSTSEDTLKEVCVAGRSVIPRIEEGRFLRENPIPV